MVTQREILRALRHVMEPALRMNVVDMGMIRRISIQGDIVDIEMVCDPPFCRVPDTVTEQARMTIAALHGVKEVRVTRIDEPWKTS